MPAAIDDILGEVARLLAQRAGMARESIGEAVLAQAVRKRGGDGPAAAAQDYLRRLLADPGELQELFEELAVPETWFFRDGAALRLVARQAAAGRADDRRAVRVLSAGCSTGEEAYSAAMALCEAGLTPQEFSILGADLSRRALALAAEGIYAPRSFREADETTAAARQRWCDPLGESWQVRQELRQRVEFRWGNLTGNDFLGDEAPFDVVLCRNVLIYFHADARGTVVAHLRRLLCPDGLLCAAAAEARIFAEAGLASLGSACPFVFRHAVVADGAAQPPVTAPPRVVAAVAKRQAVPQPAFPAAVAQREDVSEREILAAAQRAADEGRLDEADALCGQALARAPGSAEAHCLRGVVRQARGALAEAQRSLEKALYLDPRHWQALVHMMLLAEERGDHRAAANYRRRAQQAAPGEGP